jgi:hypothetical protein
VTALVAAAATGEIVALLAATPLPLRIAAISAAALLALSGLFMLWGGRDFSEPPLDDQGDNPPPRRTPLHALRRNLSRPARTALGICALILAWHAVAWTHPHLPLIQVPLARWWALAVGTFLAVWGSLAIDRYERR